MGGDISRVHVVPCRSLPENRHDRGENIKMNSGAVMNIPTQRILAPVLSGALTLRGVGKPDSGRTSDVPMAGVEKTTAWVSKGIYKYLRHPIYASGIFGAWGVFFKHTSWLTLILALGSSAFWWVAARTEEDECIG
jgi:protein-S-isoprenylcysteine O-methyltransferase Ste14